MSMNEDLRHIAKDNEQVAAEALSRGDYVQAFLLVHVLIESLLRTFLKVDSEKKVRFSDLIKEYDAYLKSQHYPYPDFVDDLEKFNERRNRIVHDLWKNGFSVSNRQTKRHAHDAVIRYGLFIEFLETFDETITESGFRYLKPEDPMSPEEMARLEESVKIVYPHLFPGEEKKGE